MNSLLYLLVFLSFLFSDKALQISSKLDFGQKRSFSDETSSVTNGRRKTNPAHTLRVIQRDENNDPKPLALVCASTSTHCKPTNKPQVQNIPKADVVVQIITNSQNRSSTDGVSIDVPDVPIVVGTKGSSGFIPNIRQNVPAITQPKSPPPLTRKVYVPLFGSSVIEAPESDRNHRTINENQRNLGPYPYNYGDPNFNYFYGSNTNSFGKSYIPLPTRGLESNIYRGKFHTPGWNHPKLPEESYLYMNNENVACTCYNREPHYHQVLDSKKNIKISAIDSKIAPLE